MTAKRTKVARWLDDKFRAWRDTQSEGNAGVTQFARHIGITRDDLNNYLLRGARPEGKKLLQIARALGPEIYDLLGLARPDPQLRQVMKAFVRLPPDQRGLAEAVLTRPGVLQTVGQTLAALGAAPASGRAARTPRQSARAEWKKLIDALDDEQVQALLKVARELRLAELKEQER
jgi:hypothetical protein